MCTNCVVLVLQHSQQSCPTKFLNHSVAPRHHLVLVGILEEYAIFFSGDTKAVHCIRKRVYQQTDKLTIT